MTEEMWEKKKKDERIKERKGKKKIKRFKVDKLFICYFKFNSFALIIIRQLKNTWISKKN